MFAGSEFVKQKFFGNFFLVKIFFLEINKMGCCGSAPKAVEPVVEEEVPDENFFHRMLDGYHEENNEVIFF